MPMQYSPTKLESVCVGTQKELIWLVNVIARLANDHKWIMSSSIKDTFCTFIIIKFLKVQAFAFDKILQFVSTNPVFPMQVSFTFLVL